MRVSRTAASKSINPHIGVSAPLRIALVPFRSGRGAEENREIEPGLYQRWLCWLSRCALEVIHMNNGNCDDIS
ncbi:hypothetical protein RRG08_003841 [Elysia crispata]|uniref:Uncharacterized protein n=1 Tax=Elysia crispata TaxID=231223 RepID=A0AAE1DF43_9GAST|nr:hypothetical protein RRG08_003841 [Elysia crispata]